MIRALGRTRSYPGARVAGWAALLLLLLLAVGALALRLGTPALTWPALLDLLAAGGGARITRIVVLELRLPRLLIGMISGALLALAGAILQATLRNPLAGPELLGISSGASIVVAVITIFKLPVLFQLTPWLALGGGLLGGTMVLLAARAVQDALRLVLIGATVSALLNAVLIGMLSLATQSEVTLLFFFLMGSLANRTWQQVGLLAPWALVGAPLALAGARALNALHLGDDVATNLGMNVGRVRLLLLSLSAALVAAVVAVCGPIGWIALLAPHIARHALGTPDARQVLPIAALLGAALLSGADLLARLALAPEELPVGIWTTLIGGPLLVMLLHCRREGAL
jgi:iron complex transport system permease protein